MDIDEAERVMLDEVRRAFGQYLAAVDRSVFSDPQSPDWLLWPTDAWPAAVAGVITPAAASIFAQVLADHGVTDPAVVDSATATFVGQDLSPVVTSAHIPDQTYQWVFDAAVVGSAAALLSPAALLWQPMLGVMALNAGAASVNAADYVSGRLLSGFGRRNVFKKWIAKDDEKTRLTHANVDNTTVSVNDVFIVGGFPLRYPHDPFGPIQETVNCRCRLIYGVRNG